MVPHIVRPLAALLVILYAVILASSVAQAQGLSLAAPGVHLEVALPDVEGAAEAAVGGTLALDVGQGLALPALGAEPVELHAQDALCLLATGDAGAEAQSAGDGEAAATESLATSPAAHAAAAGAVAALGTAALKFEPARRLLFLLALPLYSRLRRHELLDNGVRERIYRSVETNPGLSIIQVCRTGTVGWGTAVYHLQRLERDKLIVSRRDGQYRRFFLNGQAPDPAAASPGARTLAHPLAQRIAAFLVANPQAAQKDVCAALGISAPLASKWLGRMLEAGLVTSQREWKLVRYAPTPRLHEALAGPSMALPA